MTPDEKDLALVRRVAELMTYVVMKETGWGGHIYIRDAKYGPQLYDPLTNAAQCFAVLMRMGERATVCIGKRGVSWHILPHPTGATCEDNDGARRRAILECFVKGNEP